MIYKVYRYIKDKKLFDNKSKLLLAVSGGVDSVVMLDVLSNLGYENAVIAHCNFNLRGKESDEEEEFVKHLAAKYGLDIYVKHFDTLEYASNKKISVEMAARNLRYSWFETLRKGLNADKIVVAHNKNDFVETIILNMLRGTGIKGLRGILPQNGNVVRPLLCVSRQEIESYAQKQGIKYKNDSSNFSIKYRRNFIRHKVFPLFKELNPSFVDTLYEVGERVTEANSLLVSYLDSLKNSLIKTDYEDILIEKDKILEQESIVFLLDYFLHDYGFEYRQCKEIADSIHNVGRYFKSSTGYTLWIERKYLRISKKHDKKENSKKENHKYLWTSLYKLPEKLPFDIDVKIVAYSKEYIIKKDTSIAQLDLDKLDFPLTFRKWQAGDKFYPLGMKKMKKISDFLIDEKVELKEKNNIFVLSDKNNNIIWVVGYRIDDRYKITDKTNIIVVIKNL